MKRTWLRVLPAVLVGSLLVIAAVAPRARGRAPAESVAMVYPGCDLLLQQGGSTSPWAIAPLAGVAQPIGAAGNIAACSLTVVPSYSYSFARLDLVQWDPTTLAPDPTTVALRTRSFDATAIIYGKTRADFYPPVVTRAHPEAADPPRSTTAFEFRVTSPPYSVPTRFQEDGAPEVPAAQQIPAGGAPRAPLPGAHPVLSHTVCGGNDALQSLQVIQSVMTTNSLSDTSCFELIQRFRVPARSRLHWVEVAFGVNPYPQYYDPVISILDADGASVPPTPLPSPLVEGLFAYYVSSPFWGSHYDFDRLIILEPDHDYWLMVRVEHRYLLYSRTLTGGETANFTDRIGPYFRRTTAAGNWLAEPGRALCFRLIGEPATRHSLPRGKLEGPRGTGTGAQSPRTASQSAAELAAQGAVAGRQPLRLSVVPNPSRGASFVSWSGAVGRLRIEVMDAQGRRICGVDARSEAEGRWLWSGAHDDGRPAPAGVYFVRATDGEGHIAAHRVVLIR